MFRNCRINGPASQRVRYDSINVGFTAVVKAGKIKLDETEDTEQVSFVEKHYRHELWNVTASEFTFFIHLREDNW